MWGPDGKDCLTLFQPIRNGTKNCLTIFGWHSGWPLSLTRLDTGRAPIKRWQVLKALAAQIWVLTRCLFRIRMECRLSSPRSNPVYKLLISRAQLFSLWRFFAPEKLRESFYIWSPDLPRAVPAKTGEKSKKQVKRFTFAPNRKFLPISQPFFPPLSETRDLSGFLFPIFETECKILQPYCLFLDIS